MDGRGKHLVGVVCDHPLIRHGARVVTSKVEWIDERAGLARTKAGITFWGAVQLGRYRLTGKRCSAALVGKG